MPPDPPPAVLERILALRPTSAATRLGDSTLPLLNPRDLARALEGGAAPLVCVPVAAVEAIPGLLRAARDQDAVLGLAAPYRPTHRDAPDAFFDAVRAAADECRHVRPVFLQAGPIRLTSAEPRELQLRADDVYRFVDAGFSLLSVDASTLVPEAGVLVASELVRAAAERELSVEIAAPVDESGRADPVALETCLRGFAAKKVEVRFVRVRLSSPDAASLRALAEVAGRFGAWLSVEALGPTVPTPEAWGPAGARKLDAGGPFTRLVLGALEPELRASLEVRAKATGVATWELLAQFGDPLQDAAPRAREKVEALSYAEALDLLERAGARGSASASVAFLAERAGY
ncbi:MAG TPA: hypothetical protein VFA20_06715 [Myxococcaceae bacterium]|nr:hypothetical protein [Myxococcaceae bacterium]